MTRGSYETYGFDHYVRNIVDEFDLLDATLLSASRKGIISTATDVFQRLAYTQ